MINPHLTKLSVLVKSSMECCTLIKEHISEQVLDEKFVNHSYVLGKLTIATYYLSIFNSKTYNERNSTNDQYNLGKLVVSFQKFFEEISDCMEINSNFQYLLIAYDELLAEYTAFNNNN